MRSGLNVPHKPMLPDFRARDLIEDARSCGADAARGARLVATRLAPRRRRRCAFAAFPADLGIAAPLRAGTLMLRACLPLTMRQDHVVFL